MRHKTSSKYLASVIFLEALFAVSFGMYAFGNGDQGRKCYGQTLKSFKLLDVAEYSRVTPFTIEGA